MNRAELSGLWYSRLPFLPEQKCCIVYWLWYEQSAWQELKHLFCNETNIPRQLMTESSGPNWRNAPLRNSEIYLRAVGPCWVLSPLAIVSNQLSQGKYIKTHIHHSIYDGIKIMFHLFLCLTGLTHTGRCDKSRLRQKTEVGPGYTLNVSVHTARQELAEIWKLVYTVDTNIRYTIIN